MGGVYITLDRKRTRLKGITPSVKGKFRSDIYYKRRKIYLGTFSSPLDAAIAYDDLITKMKIDKTTNFTELKR